jgi:predicted alpha/beta-hydrolase family hydrolase
VNHPAEPFSDVTRTPAVRGFIHRVEKPGGRGLVLTHGAGSNGRAPLLVAVAEAFAGAGITVLRCDLPFRQDRPFGPPRPGDAKRDCEGLRNASVALQKVGCGQVFLGGHSYGGRQATMLCAEHPDLVAGLLLQSYPLHPPGRPEQLRVQHFPNLRLPALFVHGTRDPFGSVEEMRSALKLIPAKTQLLVVDGAGHDLGFKAKSARQGLPGLIVSVFQELFAQC